MTVQAWVHLWVVMAMLLAAYQTQAGWLYVFGSGGVAVLLAAWVLAIWNARGVDVAFAAPRPVASGAWVSWPVRISRRLGACAGALQILKSNRQLRWFDGFYRDALVPAEWSYAVVSPQPGSDATAELRFVAPARGEHPLPPVVLQSGDPLGLIVRWHILRPKGTLLVFPKIWRVDALPWLSAVLEAAGVKRQAQLGPGHAVRGVREHRPGDPLSQIHWRTTARTGRLHVKETEQERGTALCVWVDTHHDGAGAEVFEHMLEVTASVVAYLQRVGLAFTLASQAGELTPGEDPWPWLARLQPVSLAPRESAPLGALVITSTLPAKWQGRAGGLVYCPAAVTGRLPSVSCLCPVGASVTTCLQQGAP